MEREDSRSPTVESQRRRSIGEAAEPAMREWRSGSTGDEGVGGRRWRGVEGE
ncbi:hypothetical protein QJS10_CPA02g00547 [Acorus calamus]|uniref:Uncharacterized protein n=1 Tax=Acorus calamus TaxID=4465 RepID=A0AAV9FDK5_ACOCL|nr:hypothetical protein QJS10_CPA02g00547 [Acorus calamus]